MVRGVVRGSKWCGVRWSEVELGGVRWSGEEEWWRRVKSEEWCLEG